MLPFNCFSYPEISAGDEALSVSQVFEPLCQSVIDRKRKLEQSFRAKFNRFNREVSAGEDVLCAELQLEAEKAALEEDRRKVTQRRKVPKIALQPTQPPTHTPKAATNNNSSSHNNNHSYTVQQASATSDHIDDESEHDNAVKGLLENF